MRALAARALLVLLLGGLGFAAWLTQNPEAEILARATRWPVVGGWASSFRDAYLPREAGPEPAADAEPEVIVIEAPELTVEEVDRAWGARPKVWVQEGTAVRVEPATGAGEIARTGGITNLRVFDRRGDWYRVRYRGRMGWVHLEGYEESDEPPLGRDPLPPGPLPARPPDSERLAFARELLADGGVQETLGDYDLYTDRADPEMIRLLERLVPRLEDVYSRRYGVTPVGEADGAIVLFSRREDFAAYQAREVSLRGLEVAGVAGAGIVAVDLEGRAREEIAATLVHELTHLLNRRALGPALPAWLEEGLADDLANSEVDPQGQLETARLGGLSLRRRDGWEWRGARASAISLRRALDQGQLRPLAELLALDWREFVASGAEGISYPQASFWVRHLLADRALAAGFRAYLASVAAGGSAEPEALRGHLGADWVTLDRAFARWVRISFHDVTAETSD